MTLDGKRARPDVAGETGMPFETFPDAAPRTTEPARQAVSAVSARIRDMDDPPGSGGIGEAPALPLI
jgi:hypothetical protein